MAKSKVQGKLIGNMGFEMTLDGHRFVTDASEENGGNDLGPRPKQMLLAGLIGCTGMDVMSMLTKMRSKPKDLIIEVETDVTDEHPKVYKDIHLVYRFKGEGLSRKNIEKAVSLSQEKYCGVSAMLKEATPVTYEIVVEE
ncbi:MAG: OsmC family protein [Clostridiales bacterium]|nr:OsmC family protein [Clostridiales bacterium]